MKTGILIVMLFVCIANKPVYSQTYNPVDSLALLAIDADCDASDSLNWNIQPDPGSWDGVTWDNSTPKRVIQLDIDSNRLDNTMDLSALDSLTSVDCSFNILDTISVAGLSKLTYLLCFINQLTSLDLTGATGLTNLQCNSNQLAILDVSLLSNLTYFACNFNQFTSLDLSSLVNLDRLYCHGNQFTSLDVSSLTNLTEFSCHSTMLTQLDVTSCTNLMALYCGYSKLNNLNVTGLSLLSTLFANDNELTGIDVSSLSNLSNFTCYNNYLSFSTLADYLFVDNLYYEPMLTIYTSDTLAGTYTIDYSGEALIEDSTTTFVFFKDDNPVDTNTTGLYTTNGQGDYNCQMTNGHFPGLELTTAKITMTTETPEVSVSPSTLNFDAAGISIDTFIIASNTAWIISGLETWLTASRLSGILNDTIILTVTANPDTSIRTAIVTISAIGVTPQTINVTQEAPIYLILSETTLYIDALANSTADFDIASNTTWTVESSQNWLSVDPASGSNRETITLTAEANSGSSGRSSIITVSGAGVDLQTIAVTQAAVIPMAMSLTTTADAMIYPCPAIDFMNVKLEPEDLPSIINLYTIDGILLMQQETSNIITEMDMTKYSSGIYILRVVTSGSIIEKKVLKY